MGLARGLLGVLVVAWCVASWGAESELKPGDMATVKVERAAIREGQEVLAWLNKGQRIKNHYVQGGFALVWFTVGGEAKQGYIKVTDLEAPSREERKRVEPTYVADDEVVVVGKEAKLMLGKETLGLVAAGARLTVKKVNDKWLGVYAPIDGKRTWGWVHSRDVDYAPFGEKDKGGEKREGPPKGSSEK